jgi:LacI family xylobiose transport system transcriptional regulator
MLALADPPTAIFAGNDIEAMGVYEAARLHQLRIPDDLSVVGFDDLEMSAWVSPPLTTVAQPLARMAAMATRMVLDPAADEASRRVELATSLVIRSSTAAPAARAAR